MSEKTKEPNRTTHVWTDDDGMQLLVEEYDNRIEIVAVAVSDEPDVRYSVSLEGRRSALGTAILPAEDRRALEVGFHILYAFKLLKGEPSL